MQTKPGLVFPSTHVIAKMVPQSCPIGMVKFGSVSFINEKEKRGTLLIHGSYYNFVLCTLEKWTPGYDKRGNTDDQSVKSLRSRISHSGNEFVADLQLHLI